MVLESHKLHLNIEPRFTVEPIVVDLHFTPVPQAWELEKSEDRSRNLVVGEDRRYHEDFEPHVRDQRGRVRFSRYRGIEKRR